MDIETTKNLPATTKAANPFIEAASDLDLGSLPYLKFAKNEWTVSTDNSRIGDELFAVDVSGAEHGFVCFCEGSAPALHMVPVSSGRKVHREDLPNPGSSQDGDGWKEAVLLHLIRLSTGEEFTFLAISRGAHRAVAKLLRRFGLRPGVPIVKLGGRPYKTKLRGLQHEPVFQIVEWREVSAAKAPEDLRGDNDMNDEIPF